MPWYANDALTDTVALTVADIRREIILGFHPHEKTTPQTVLFTARVFVKGGQTDNVEDTFNYDEVIPTLDSVLAEGPYELQETILESFASRLLARPQVKAVFIKSVKTQAYRDAAYASCELFRMHRD